MNKYYVRFDLTSKKWVVIGPDGYALTKYNPRLNIETTRTFIEKDDALAYAERCNVFDESSE